VVEIEEDQGRRGQQRCSICVDRRWHCEQGQAAQSQERACACRRWGRGSGNVRAAVSDANADPARPWIRPGVLLPTSTSSRCRYTDAGPDGGTSRRSDDDAAGSNFPNANHDGAAAAAAAISNPRNFSCSIPSSSEYCRVPNDCFADAPTRRHCLCGTIFDLRYRGSILRFKCTEHLRVNNRE